MKCHVCGEKTSVLETRGASRRRVCPNQHIFWTQEVLDKTHRPPKHVFTKEDREKALIVRKLTKETHEQRRSDWTTPINPEAG